MTRFKSVGVFILEKVWFEPNLFPYNRQSVPKRRHIKFRRLGITQKKAYDIQNTAKVLNQE